MICNANKTSEYKLNNIVKHENTAFNINKLMTLKN